jgi:hypothetical protein
VALCLALLIAPLGRLLADAGRWRTAGMALAMGLLIVPNLSHLRARQAVDVDLAFWTPEQLAMRGFETTTGGEVTPRWITGLPGYTPLAATVLSGEAEILHAVREPFDWSSRVRAKAASTIEMNTAWYPGWQVKVDGRQVAAGPGRQSGLITFEVPAGDHEVEAEYGRTALENWMLALSTAALIAGVMMRGESYLNRK